MGNLTFGGTGKTPFVIHACREIQRRGKRPAILSRGYRARGAERNDEARVIAAHLPDVPHVQDPDRFAAGMGLLEAADCFVLDDGFQHHPLRRDADVVLVDATDPFGGGFCPPAGRLREPLSAVARADLVVITRADLVDREALGETMRGIRERTAAPVATGRFRPECEEPLEGRELLLACGIGNPRAFVATVESMGARVARRRFFRDHHPFTARDAEALASQGLPVVVTEKDAVKLAPIWRFDVRLHVVRISFEAQEGRADLDALFDRLCAR